MHIKQCRTCFVVAGILLILLTLLPVSVFNSPKTEAANLWSEEYDAAEGILHNVGTESSESGYYGKGYVAGWNSDGQAVDIEVNVPSEGNYTLVFKYSGGAGSAIRYLDINGVTIIDKVRFSGTGGWGDWQTTYVNNVFLTAGKHTVTLGYDSSKGSANWLNYDSLIVQEPSPMDVVEWGLNEEAELAQESLHKNFWNKDTNLFNNQYPNDRNNNQFHYWWLAHGIDVLIDGYERSGDQDYLAQAGSLYEGIKTRNGGDIRNHFYDDMLWMALALQRLHIHTGNPEYEQAVFTLWNDIKNGWNDGSGGGIAWNKSQLDYKNTPSNAPAVILAARLYDQYGKEEDLAWAKKIYNWQRDTLVDPTNGFVWDGINRTGNGQIDKNWAFTYNQGVYIGASVELFEITGEKQYLDAADQTAKTTMNEFSNHNGIIYEGGAGDGGLFKGILIRYVTELVKADESQLELAEWVVKNAKSAWNQTKDQPEILFGSSWEGAIHTPIELSQQLSGVMLLEKAAELEPIIFENISKTLSLRIDQYEKDGHLEKSLAKKLSNRIRQVQHHYDKGHIKQAIKHLQDFEDHLQKGKSKGEIEDSAYIEIQKLLHKVN